MQPDSKSITFLASAQRTASVNSADFDLSLYKELLVFLSITAQGSYTDETMDIDIQTKNPLTGDYHTVSSFTQVTGDKGSGFTDYKAIATGLGGTVRVAVTTAGTAEDYTYSISGVAKRT